LGSAAYTHDANLFDDLFFSDHTPLLVLICVFLFTSKNITSASNLLIAIVVLPQVVSSSQMAKYMLYIGGFCESPVHYLLGVVLPWVIGAVINHLQIYSYLINWTALVTMMYVQFVCPMFMWAKACKEASIFETNFKASMQMMLLN
jgi:hypothetical protein